MIPSFEYTIVGAGIAGMKAAEAIRTIHPDATILLINGEKQPPYKRTKLSKLVGQPFDAEAIRLQPQSWFDSQHIALMHDLVKSFDIEKKSSEQALTETFSMESLFWQQEYTGFAAGQTKQWCKSIVLSECC